MLEKPSLKPPISGPDLDQTWGNTLENTGLNWAKNQDEKPDNNTTTRAKIIQQYWIKEAEKMRKY